jgi:hypothetical protein
MIIPRLGYDIRKARPADDPEVERRAVDGAVRVAVPAPPPVDEAAPDARPDQGASVQEPEAV